MSARVWQAVAALADVWRTSEVVQRYGGAALGYGAAAVWSSAAHIDAQPFYLCEYFHTRVAFDDDGDRRTRTPEWIEDGANLAHAYTMLIEFLRSRLPGYPFAGLPHLSASSPWTDFNVSMAVPWLPEWHGWNMQQRRTPPVFPEIAVANQLPAMWELVTAFHDCPTAQAITEAWQALSDADHAQLANARKALDMAHYPERPGQTSGDEDFRHLDWAECQLDAITDRLDGRAGAFSEALLACNRFLQQVAALFSHLVFYERIRVLDGINLVQQLSGSDGWHTVRSGHFSLQPIRLHEVVGFNHPYPRGLMMVEGTKDVLPFGAHTGAMTVHGRLLPDSANLNGVCIAA